MKTISSFLSIAAIAKVVLAGGSIDNSAEADAVRSAASTLSGAGNYIFTNVATGGQLSFRRDSVTNFYPSSEGGDANQVQFNGSAARVSGGNNKCASAQWSYEVEGGVDAFAVPYACAVGDGQSGTKTLEKTKQWWYFVPAEGSSSSNDTGDDSNDGGDVNGSSSGSLGVSLAVKTTKTSNSSDDSSNNATSQFLSHSKGYYEYNDSTIPRDLIDQSNQVVGDRSTWPCVHPGWWLNRHPDYVNKDGHVECKDDLKAYRAAQPSARRVRRSRPTHTEMARNFVKRGATQYYIVAQDHLDDMATRAIGSQSVSSFGGYTSTNLVLWDKSDEHQLWTITEA